MVKNVGGSPHRSPVLASSGVRRFDDAQQQHIGLVRPGDIADDRDVVEANTAQASSPSSPPPDFSYYPGISFPLNLFNSQLFFGLIYFLLPFTELIGFPILLQRRVASS
jgi:hypothetical protein